MITAKRLLRNQEVSVPVPDNMEYDGKRWIVDVSEEVVAQMMITFTKQHLEKFSYSNLPLSEYIKNVR